MHFPVRAVRARCSRPFAPCEAITLAPLRLPSRVCCHPHGGLWGVSLSLMSSHAAPAGRGPVARGRAHLALLGGNFRRCQGETMDSGWTATDLSVERRKCCVPPGSLRRVGRQLSLVVCSRPAPLYPVQKWAPTFSRRLFRVLLRRMLFVCWGG